MARGATWDPELEERVGDGDRRGDPRAGRQLLRRRLHQPAAPPGVGPRPGDLRRGARRCSARWARRWPAGAQRHVMACVKHFACNSMENARFSVDVKVDERDAARGLPAALPRGRGGGRRQRDERLQLRERRVVRPEPHAADRDPARRVGLRGLRHVGLHLGPARPGRLAGRRAGHRDAVRAAARRTLPTGAGRGHRRLGGRRAGRRCGSCAPSSVRRGRAANRRPAPESWSPPSTARSPARSRPGRWCCCATSRSTAVPCCRWTRARCPGSPCWGGSRTSRTPATTARPTSGRRRWSRRSPACARRSPEVEIVRPATGRRRPRPRPPRRRRRGGRRRRLHRARTRASTSGRSTRRSPPSTRRRPRTGRSGGARHGSGTPARRTVGGDRDVAAAAPGRRGTGPRGRRGEPAHGRRRGGRRRGRDGGVAARRPGDPARLVRRHGGRRARSPTSCSGTREPGGRLPFAVPRSEADLPPFDRTATRVVYDRWHGQRRLDRDGVAAAYPLGFGLSYTSFTDRRGRGRPEHGRRRERRRAGHQHGPAGRRPRRAGVRAPAGGPGRPAERFLAGFARVECPAGERQKVRIEVPRERLAVRHGRGDWRLLPGEYRFDVGAHAADPDGSSVRLDLP